MMTEEQKHAEEEIEKTLGTLSEEELDMLAGGKVTDDVKKFLKTEKGKEIMKYTGIIVGTAVPTAVASIAVTAVLVRRHYEKKYKPALTFEPTDPSEYGRHS